MNESATLPATLIDIWGVVEQTLLWTVIYGFVMGAAFYLVRWFDLKTAADLEARVGPARGVWAGFDQSFADVIKLIAKSSTRDYGPWAIGVIFFWLGLVNLIPLTRGSPAAEAGFSAFLPVFFGVSLALYLCVAGRMRNRLASTLTSLRIFAQMFSVLMPIGVCLLGVGFEIGSLGLVSAVEAQGFSPSMWLIAQGPPFGAILFLVFYISGLVLLALPPFDAGQNAAELGGGVFGGITGPLVVVLGMLRIYGLIFWSALSVSLFLGGWAGPAVIGELSFVLKILFLVTLVLWAGRATPRLHAEQNCDFGWKVLAPFSLLGLVGWALWAIFKGAHT